MLRKVFNKLTNIINKFTKGRLSEIYLLKGEEYANKGDYTNAIKTIKLSLIADPVNLNALINLADIYDDIGNYDQAIELLSEALNIYPENDSLFYNLAISYEHRGENATAIKYYKKSIEINIL